MSEQHIGTIVTSSLDLENPRPLSDEERLQLERLRRMSDDEIDFSDIPPQVGKPWRRVYGPRFQGKTQEMVVLEPDVVDFFRATGEMSAGRINAALREYVEQQRKRA